MTTNIWRTDTPTRDGWFTTDRDPDLMRHWTGARWSAPVHRDDLDRIGERVRGMPAEPRDRDDPIAWLNVPEADRRPGRRRPHVAVRPLTTGRACRLAQTRRAPGRRVLAAP